MRSRPQVRLNRAFLSMPGKMKLLFVRQRAARFSAGFGLLGELRRLIFLNDASEKNSDDGIGLGAGQEIRSLEPGIAQRQYEKLDRIHTGIAQVGAASL